MKFIREGKMFCYKCLGEVDVEEAFVITTNDRGFLLFGHFDCGSEVLLE